MNVGSYTLSAIDRIVEGPGRILIASDFDGTLSPIVGHPSEAQLLPETLEILSKAAACRRLTLAVISGRGLADIRNRVPLDIAFGGNHGLEIAGSDWSYEHEEARELRPTLMRACEALTPVARRWPGAWVEDKGLSATLHFRGVDPEGRSSLLFDARRALRIFEPGLVFRMAKLALELRPDVLWDKGDALRYIREKAGPFAACISLGDDRTDEAMFRANRGQLNLRIGHAAATAADVCLANPAEAAAVLRRLVSAAAKGLEYNASSSSDADSDPSLDDCRAGGGFLRRRR